MPLECTMICVDNSEWMRNGDYVPTRLGAQQDAANMICNDRCMSNPENTVGVLAMAGKGVELLVSPTEDSTKILASFARISIGGNASFVTSIQIAQLALKHRKNKAGGQRIVAFVGSPVTEDAETLQKVGKLLKKNNVAVDVISIGEVEANHGKLTAFVEAVVSHDSDNRPNSNLIVVPAGVHPGDALMSSPVMHGFGGMGMGGGAGAGGGGGGGGGGDLGFDESLDPELAMALRVSAEEARASVQASMDVDSSGAGASAGAAGAAAAGLSLGGDADDEEALMQQALAMSLADSAPAPSSSSSSSSSSSCSSSSGSQGAASGAAGAEDEDEELRLALELSMAAAAAPATTSSSTAPPQPPAAAADYLDPEALSAMLAEVTGKDGSDDPLIQAALEQIRQQAEQDKKAGESKKRKEDDK